jgi:hypothetical protein
MRSQHFHCFCIKVFWPWLMGIIKKQGFAHGHFARGQCGRVRAWAARGSPWAPKRVSRATRVCPWVKKKIRGLPAFAHGQNFSLRGLPALAHGRLFWPRVKPCKKSELKLNDFPNKFFFSKPRTKLSITRFQGQRHENSDMSWENRIDEQSSLLPCESSHCISLLFRLFNARYFINLTFSYVFFCIF